MNSRLNSVALAAMALSAGVSASYYTNTRYAGGPPTKKSGVCYNSDGNNTVDGAGGTEEANKSIDDAGANAGEQSQQQDQSSDTAAAPGSEQSTANKVDDVGTGESAASDQPQG